MIHRNLDSDGDWTFGAGIQNYTRDQDAILLNVKTRLQSWKGDCFFALTEGVDYNNLLDVGTKSLLDSDVKRVILQSEGVIKIVLYESELNRDTRGLTASCTVQTVFGVGDLAEVEKTQSDNDLEVANKIIPAGNQKLTPDGFFKIVFVKKV